MSWTAKIRLHPQHVAPLHRAAQIDDGERIGAVNSARCGTIQNVPSPSVTAQRTTPRLVDPDRDRRAAKGWRAPCRKRPQRSTDPLPSMPRRPAIGRTGASPTRLQDARSGARRRGTVPRCGRGLAEAQRAVAAVTNSFRSSQEIRSTRARPDRPLHFCNRPLRILGHSPFPFRLTLIHFLLLGKSCEPVF